MAKKMQWCKRAWFNEADEKTSSPRADTVRGVFTFNGGETLNVNLVDVHENCQAALPWMGLSEKLQNAMANAEATVEGKTDAVVAMYERLKLGEWVTEGTKAGPRISVIAEAILRAKTAAGIKDTIEAIVERLANNKELRERALERPEIKAAHEAIKAERAAERAAKAAEAAGGVGAKESKAELGDF